MTWRLQGNGCRLPCVDPIDATRKEAALTARRLLALLLITGLGLSALIGAVAGAIALAVPVTRQFVSEAEPKPVPGITHLRAVDDRLLRGDAPSDDSYAELARRGVTTIVDLRAERDVDPRLGVIAEAGLERVHIPIRDGQTRPSRVSVYRVPDTSPVSRGTGAGSFRSLNRWCTVRRAGTVPTGCGGHTNMTTG